jgi:hypothetical protein
MLPDIPVQGTRIFFSEFELRLEPMQNLCQALLQEVILTALHGNPFERIEALSFIYSDEFDIFCDYVGWHADKWRSEVNKYIEGRTNV